jgi:hypothetical protein
MHRSIRFKALVAAGLAAAALGAQLAHAALSVPKDIQVPAGNTQFLVGHAVGVQIYSCNGSSWSFVAPRANLYDDFGRRIAIHFAGPTWRAKDGSFVVGQKLNGVTVDATAIPWLLLSAAKTGAATLGRTFADTTYVQRIETMGGLAPAPSTCNSGTAGRTAEVPYTADYTFWRAAGD